MSIQRVGSWWFAFIFGWQDMHTHTHILCALNSITECDGAAEKWKLDEDACVHVSEIALCGFSVVASSSLPRRLFYSTLSIYCMSLNLPHKNVFVCIHIDWLFGYSLAHQPRIVLNIRSCKCKHFCCALNHANSNSLKKKIERKETEQTRDRDREIEWHRVVGWLI